eukprot:TRINITY_DN40150_c0_g1_i1.p1 TRINITY_DN40150_c0_g1~~TRINITY_DN40150_c0_g1_i1.p1  ORF type:complete len:883 (-),score=117.82 TRINITY_DN40150_c0_g1_i1:7216-9864(-)
MSHRTNVKRGSRDIRISQLRRPLAVSLRAAQALLDPAAILKELLENSLDAQATRIDLRIRGTGCLSSIVVSDNGKGIEEADMARVCLPSTTSKLSKMVDIERIASFGFRGEALSAICGIARCLTIVSRTSGQSVAKRAQYGPSGSLLTVSPAARGVGTTVNVEDVFHRLPVRKKEALAHPARQLARCIAVVQAVALIAVSVRVELRVGSDLKVANAPLLLHSKEGGCSADDFHAALRKNAIAVLGRSAHALHEVSGSIATVLEPEVDLGGEVQYKCRGLASSASLNANGSGRARSSYQYFFVNRRPVDLPRLQRSLTELYRTATGQNSASPVLVLNIELPLWAVDANLSPDKRSVAIYEEEKMIEGVVGLLKALWVPTDKTQIPLSKDGDLSILLKPKQQSKKLLTLSSEPRQREHPDQSSSGSHKSEPDDDVAPNSDKPGTVCDGERLTELEDIPELPSLSSEEELEHKVKSRESDSMKDTGGSRFDLGHHKEMTGESEALAGQLVTEMQKSKLSCSKEGQKRNKSLRMSLLTKKRPHDVSSYVAKRSKSLRSPQKRHRSTPPPTPQPSKNMASTNGMSESKQLEADAHAEKSPELSMLDAPRSNSVSQLVQSKMVHIPVDWDILCQDYVKYAAEREKTSSIECSNERTSSSAFKKSSLQSCEEDALSMQKQGIADREMSRLFRQVWFKDLKVVGQFNRAFIIARLGSDMFIVDQHASDEKYNFEDLERSTIISKQKLVRPMRLDFSAEDELIVLQYLDAFKAGGFEIEHDGSRPPTQRLLLRTQPASKHTIFVRDDLQDMVNLLKNNALHSPGTAFNILRPPRVRAMLASRACRKSIMVGRALSDSQMRKVLSNLAELQHPWTCPHGRPTMRHLFELPTL